MPTTTKAPATTKAPVPTSTPRPPPPTTAPPPDCSDCYCTMYPSYFDAHHGGPADNNVNIGQRCQDDLYSTSPVKQSYKDYMDTTCESASSTTLLPDRECCSLCQLSMGAACCVHSMWEACSMQAHAACSAQMCGQDMVNSCLHETDSCSMLHA